MFQRFFSLFFQSLCLPKTQEPLDLGIYPPHTSSLGHPVPGPSLGHHGTGLGPHTSGIGQSTSGLGLKEDEKSEQPKDTQYLSANCVLMTYYNGDISSVVDEHFTRSLSQQSSYSPESQGAKTTKGTFAIFLSSSCIHLPFQQ